MPQKGNAYVIIDNDFTLVDIMIKVFAILKHLIKEIRYGKR